MKRTRTKRAWDWLRENWQGAVGVGALLVGSASFVHSCNTGRRTDAQVELQRRPWLTASIDQAPAYGPGDTAAATRVSVENRGQGAAEKCRVRVRFSRDTGTVFVPADFGRLADRYVAWIEPGREVDLGYINVPFPSDLRGHEEEFYAHICGLFRGAETGRWYYYEHVFKWGHWYRSMEVPFLPGEEYVHYKIVD